MKINQLHFLSQILVLRILELRISYFHVYSVILSRFILVPNAFPEKVYNTFFVSREKSRIMIMKSIVVLPSKFPVKLISISLLNQRWRIVVYWDLLQSAFSFLWSMHSQASNLLCNHLLDLWQFFECCHIFLCYFLQSDHKSCGCRSWRCSLLFLPLEDSIVCIFLWLDYPLTIKQKICKLFEN